MKKICGLIISVLIMTTLCSCTTTYDADKKTPQIVFTAKTETDGKPEYYLFDDNPEHLNGKYFADGENPNAIAHFENLTPGIYTVFSYHHRGKSLPESADLFFDTVFSSENGGEFKIDKMGINPNWDWNQAWADYTGVPVSMPLYFRTSNSAAGEPTVIRDEHRTPETELYDHLGTVTKLESKKPIFMSDCIQYIKNSGLNKFRNTSYADPIWMMMKFEVLSGTVSFDIVAYQDKEAVIRNFATMGKGAFENEPQYKGKADSAPFVTTEFSYEMDDNTKAGSIPVIVKNTRVPDGYIITNGTFATNINTWREKYPITAESDMMKLEYKDDSKLSLYGKNVKNRDNIWRFDPQHTKLTNDENKYILDSFGVKTGDEFVPNVAMSEIKHPKGNEISSEDFYSYTACNLGNYGVTDKYIIHLKNSGSKDRKFMFNINSVAGQVYRYKQYGKEEITSDGGTYYMKKFDDSPAEDPENPGESLYPERYSDTLSFNVPAKTQSTVEIEITTLTGCNAPIYNTMSVE